MSTKRLIPCAHCGAPATPNRLKTFRTIWRNEQGIVRPGPAHLVHAGCWEPYELRQARCMALESFVREHKGRGFLTRLILAPTLFQLHRRVSNWRLALAAVRKWMFQKP